MKTKKKAARGTPTPPWLLNEKTAPPIVALGAMVVVILLTLVFHTLIKPKTDETPSSKKKTTTISIQTTDGVILAADLDYPTGAGPFPAVVLIHEFGQDRSQWQSYREWLITEGFAVLRYDIRGFGGSALSTIPAGQSGWFASMPNDVEAVVTYLAKQPKIDDAKISLIGVGLGANIAFVSSGTNRAVNKSVLLTPTINTQLDGSGLDNFFPQRILGIANTSDQAALNTLMDRANDLASQSVVLDDATARGVGILDDATARTRIISWLQL